MLLKSEAATKIISQLFHFTNVPLKLEHCVTVNIFLDIMAKPCVVTYVTVICWQVLYNEGISLTASVWVI